MTFAKGLRKVFMVPQPRTAALPQMAAAVLILNQNHEVEYVNESAKSLFLPVDLIGCTLTALIASCGATGGNPVFVSERASAEPAPMRLKLADDRLLDCTRRSLWAAALC